MLSYFANCSRSSPSYGHYHINFLSSEVCGERGETLRVSLGVPLLDN